MALKYADNLKWQQERFERNLTVLDVLIGNLKEFYAKRAPHYDDEDDALEAAAQLLLFANEQVEEAYRVLEEGV